MVKKFRSFICILSFSLVLASIFQIGANAVYFEFNNIPVNQVTATPSQSVFEVCVNDGSQSFANLQGVALDTNKIRHMYLFGYPVNATTYRLYAIVGLEKGTTTSLGNFKWQTSSSIQGNGLNFYSTYNPSIDTFEVGAVSSGAKHGLVLYDWRVINLNSIHSLSISDIFHTNFKYRYGYIDSDGVYHWVQTFTYPPSLDSMPSEALNLIRSNYTQNPIDLHHTGTTTGVGDLGSNSDAEHDVNINLQLPEVTGDGFGGEVNTEDFSKLDEIIENLTDLSAEMSDNLVEMSDDFGRIRASIDSFIDNVPSVIIAVIVCAMIILIAVKIIGR